MPIFKKSSSDSGRLNESYRKVLHRYRFRLVKDLDVATIFEYLPADEGFKSDIKEQILSFPTVEERNGALLDRLETRGDRAFTLFMEALHEKYKHLAFTLESCLRSIDDADSSDHEISSTVQGDALRPILLKNQKLKMEQSQCSESYDDLDEICFEKDVSDYIPCYTVPIKGKLQQDTWVNAHKEPLDQHQEAETSFMGKLRMHLVFRELTPEEIPKEVRRPSGNVKAYIIEENEVRTDLRMPENYPKPVPKNHTQNNCKFSNHRHAKDPLPPKPKRINPPPPVPPKSLPGDSSQGSPKLPLRVKSRSPVSKACKIPTPPKPPPLPRHRTKQKESSSPEPNAPPVPPRISSAGPSWPKTSLSKPPLPTQEDGKAEKALPVVEQVEDDEEREASEDDDLLMGKEIPAPDTEEDSCAQTVVDGSAACKLAQVEDEDYEAIGTSDDLFSKRASSEITENDSGIINPPKESEVAVDNASRTVPRSITPARLRRSITPASLRRRSSSECSSILPLSDPDSTLRKSVTEASGRAVPPKAQTISHITSKQWCDISVLPNKVDSSDGDSYYEDIDALDAVKSHRSSNAYLHPRSVGRSLDRRQNSVSSSHQTATLKTMLGIYVELQVNELLVVELEDTADGEEIRIAMRNYISYLREVTPDYFSLPSQPPSPLIEQIPEHEAEAEKEPEPSSSDASISTSPICVRKTVAALESSTKDKQRSPLRTSFVVKEKPVVKFANKATQYEVNKAAQYDVNKAAQNEVNKATQYDVNKAAQNDVNKAAQNDVNKAAQYDVNKAAQNDVNKAAQNDVNNATRCDAEVHTMVTPYAAFQDTYLCYDKHGRGFYIKKKHIKRFGSPSDEPWYYPLPISSQHATLFLRVAHNNGCFLVYRTPTSSLRCPYNLSLCHGNGDVLHYHIVRNIHSDLMIDGHDHSFMSIQELVTYFTSNKSQLATRLRRPLKEVDMPISPGYHYDIQYELKRKDIALSSNIIGRGNFGVVCSGSYQHGTTVAIKVLQSGGDDHTQEEDAFVEEACTMMGLKHDHIIRLIGVSCSARPFFLITEYVPNGSLRKCLNNATIPNDHIDILFDICLQATSAMCYLESRRYLLHRDLAARNVLLTGDTCIKLADFGRARLVADDNYQAEKTEAIPIKWAAPEVLGQSTYSTKSDVWALGVLYWEILSGGELPFASMTNEQTAAYVIEGGRLDKPPGCSRDLFKVMRMCWSEHAVDRPAFAALYDTLKSKSSIYYSSEAMAAKSSSKSAIVKKAESLRRNKSMLTPSTTKKLRHKSDSTPNKVFRRSTVSDKVGALEIEATKKTSGPLPISSSETSLGSALVVDKDDLTRGNKIRKSLRKMMSLKPKKGVVKNSLNGTPEHSAYQDHAYT